MKIEIDDTIVEKVVERLIPTPNHHSPATQLVARPDESLPDEWQAGVRTGAGLPEASFGGPVISL